MSDLPLGPTRRRPICLLGMPHFISAVPVKPFGTLSMAGVPWLIMMNF
jgi:hypothetical protein